MSAFFLPLLLMVAVPQTGSPAASTSSVAPPAKVKPICRSEDVTGSIMGKRVCHSAAEWKQIDAANQAATENFRNRAPGRSGGLGN